MNEREMLKKIDQALKAFKHGALIENASNLLNTLGYDSPVKLDLHSNLPEDFIENFKEYRELNRKRAMVNEWKSIDFLFQLREIDIFDNGTSEEDDSSNNNIDKTQIESYLFFAVKLHGEVYNRTQLSTITREINKILPMPAMIIFQHGQTLTFAVINRRLHKRDETKDVLEKVTLIKDINFRKAHRAHGQILFDLSRDELFRVHTFKNFVELHQAWAKTLDTEELNKQFYRKLFTWFEWAVETAKFPTDENRVIKPEEHVIRLITRLLFIWFIKEKGLVADALFNKAQIRDLLKEDDFDNGDSYYRAVLQNLFFATLNTEIDKRTFSTGGNANHRNFSRYRYKKQMQDPDKLLSLFTQTPFINGGLFDCLDSFKATSEGGYRIDCFSDKQYKKLSIPNHLFFDENRGLLPLLEHYKFTVEENTPLDQEVALDPELLGRVFENLLAAINPETGETARKMTGSYYTPRAIVDYMVEEALVAALSQKCQPTDSNTELWNERLHYLFDYARVCDDASEWFDDKETDAIVKTISELKILDPAVGSGAFPMGVLHKLTLALRRLDPENNRWEALQKDLAGKRAADAFNTQNQQERDDELTEISDTFERYRDSDFGRKLYLIQNSIFGVDIQPIAGQIAKLRFFISLAIEQEPDTDADNFGIKPLPNLETRFVAADTLIGIDLSETKGLFQDDTVQQLLKEIDTIRERFFLANNRGTKRDLEEQEEDCRKKLEKELERQRTEWIENRQAEIEAKIAPLPNPEQREQLREKEQKTYEARKKVFDADFENACKISQWKPYDQNAKADWFDPEWMFGVTGGFDIVIGNPPYIQLQKDGGRLADLYQPCKFDTFTRTGDIYCLFYEKAQKLLKGSGHLCFITSNKWMRAGYGKKLRDYFILYTQPVQLLDMGPDVFEATVDTNVLLFQNAVSDAPVTFRGVSIGADFDRQTDNISQYLTDNGIRMEMPAENEPWAILSSAELKVRHKIEDIGKPLKDWDVNIYRGITIGCNEAFIIDEIKREQLIEQDPKSGEIIKPLLRGKDIKRYYARQSGFYILATDYDLDIPNQYPVIYNHLRTIGEQIESGEIKAKGKGLFNRDDQGENWWNLRACAFYSEFDKKKIVWQEIAKRGSFLIDTDKFYSLNTTRILTGKNLTYLLGVLNSKFFLYAFKNFYAGGHLGAKGVRFLSEFVKGVPIPPITEENQHIATQIETHVDQILDAKQTNPDTDTTSLEDEIDKLVYALYDLTEDEIAIVEGGV